MSASLRHGLRLALAALLALALPACGAGPRETVPAPAPTEATPADPARGARPARDDGATKAEAEGAVDTRCTTDADCTVKNVGNCCGDYPACVNVDSPTFPQQVKAACEREGRMAVCGFPEIAGCRCIDQRCAPVHGAGPVRSD